MPSKRKLVESDEVESSDDENAAMNLKRKAVAKKAKKAPSIVGDDDDDDDVYEADAEEVSPSSKKATKKGSKKQAPKQVYVPGQRLNLDLSAFEMPESLKDKGEDAIKGLRFGSAGLLVTRETPLYSFHITETALSGT